MMSIHSIINKVLLNNLYIGSDHINSKVHIHLNVPCRDALASGNLSKSYKQLEMKGIDTQIWSLKQSSCRGQRHLLQLNQLYQTN